MKKDMNTLSNKMNKLRQRAHDLESKKIKQQKELAKQQQKQVINESHSQFLCLLFCFVLFYSTLYVVLDFTSELL
jgi:uncharacterized membrane protein (DUF106 family)